MRPSTGTPSPRPPRRRGRRSGPRGAHWCAGFGRLGGIGGPLTGGLLIAAGLALNSIFYVLVALAVLALFVPTAARTAQRERVASDADSAKLLVGAAD